jgi:hypothetical protein
MFSWIKNILKIKSEKEYVEQYLSQSVSLADLERRQRELREKGYTA